MKVTSIRKVALFVTFLSLTGCAANKPLYSWGSYESEVYAFFKGDSVEKQIEALEKHLIGTEGKREVLPPGFYAHLGMLYGKVGRGTEAKALLDKEAQLYP